MRDKNIKPHTVDVSGLMALYGVGRNLALKIGEQAGAKIKVGSRRVVYDVQLLDLYFEKLRQEQNKAEITEEGAHYG